MGNGQARLEHVQHFSKIMLSIAQNAALIVTRDFAIAVSQPAGANSLTKRGD
jgi:hypothetical protein